MPRMPKDTGRGATGETLAKAIKMAGGVSALAARLGAGERTVARWVQWKRVPVCWTPQVEMVVEGHASSVHAWAAAAAQATRPAAAPVSAGPMFLTREEVEALTGKQRSDAQARELTQMGVKFLQRTDGSVVVLRALVEQLCGLAGDQWADRKREPRMRLRPQVQP